MKHCADGKEAKGKTSQKNESRFFTPPSRFFTPTSLTMESKEQDRSKIASLGLPWRLPYLRPIQTLPSLVCDKIGYSSSLREALPRLVSAGMAADPRAAGKSAPPALGSVEVLAAAPAPAAPAPCTPISMADCAGLPKMAPRSSIIASVNEDVRVPRKRSAIAQRAISTFAISVR
jgi:hypothetical protein